MSSAKVWTSLIASMVFVFTIVWVSLFAFVHVDPHHDGILIVPAVQVSQGKTLFKESFTQYGALTTFIQASFIRIFGPNVSAMKMSAIFFYGLSAVWLFIIWRRIFKTREVFLGFVLWFLFAYYYHTRFLSWSSVYALFFQLSSVWCMFQWIESRQLKWLTAVGGSAALAFWCRQPIGIFLVASEVGFLVIESVLRAHETRGWQNLINRSVLVLIGFAAWSLPFLVWLLWQGALNDWWLQSFAFAKSFATIKGDHFSLSFAIAAFLPGIFAYRQFVIWSAIPLAMLWMMGVMGWEVLTQRSTTQTWQRLALGVIGLASWTQYFPSSDPLHWHWAMTPVMAAAVWSGFWIVERIAEKVFLGQQQRLHTKITWAVIMLMVLGTLPLTVFITHKAWVKAKGPYTFVSTPEVLRGVLLSNQEAQQHQEVAQFITQYLDAHPQKTYLNASMDGVYSLYDPRFTAIGNMYVYWDTVNASIYPDLEAKMNAFIAAHRPLVIEQEYQMGNNYCRLATYRSDLQIVLAVPAEDVIRVVQHGQQLSIEPVGAVEIIDAQVADDRVSVDTKEYGKCDMVLKYEKS